MSPTGNASHPAVRHPHASLNSAVGDRINGVFGSMTTFWLLVCWQLGWMILATAGIWIFKRDAYPFPFLLFLSNLIQLWALPVLGNTQNRADAKRSAKADTDHEALTHIALTADGCGAVIAAVAEHLGLDAQEITKRAHRTTSDENGS